MRLAIFVDQVFWRDGTVLSTDESYILFPARLAEHFDEIVFLSRESPVAGRGPFVLEGPAFSLCPIPYYASLYDLWRSGPSVCARVMDIVRQQARSWEAILICGPHPIGQLVARECIALGVPVIPTVRQNIVEQMGAHRGIKRHVSALAARILEWDFRRLSRDRPVFTVGQEMTEKYGRYSGRVLNHVPCLVDEAQFEAFSRMSRNPDPTRLIMVGRLAPEKGHRFVFEALADLDRRGRRCTLDIVGSGPLEEELRALASSLRIDEQVTFHGHVPYGGALFELYGKAGGMVLASTTEGFPQVISEALSIGLPTVATAVGGIPSFLVDGESALLVRPRDPVALAAAIERLTGDRDLRERLERNGRALMRGNTLEANQARILRSLRDEIARRRA